MSDIDHAPALVLPPRLERALASLNEKDQRRVDEVVTRLHAVNARLWAAEDRIREVGLPAAQVADLKRQIDQLNAERNALAERADDIFVALAPTARQKRPPHTETLASAIDRLSVLTLRIWHNEAVVDHDDLARRRAPVLGRQRAELCAAIDTLVSDVQTGRVRLPTAARHKLYGRGETSAADIAPERGLERVIALGGLSESGKSTSAAFLQQTCGAQRLKIGYLFRQAAQRRGLANPYALSDRRQAEMLLDELNRFAIGHRHQRLYTIESVHNDASIAELKQLMGERLRIVYLDADFAERVRRSGMSPQAVAAKDEVKRSRGAHRVAAIADHVIDNSGSTLALCAQLRRIVTPCGTTRLRTVTPHALGLPTPVAEATAELLKHLRPLSPGLGLVTLTGSPTEHAWIPGWSDLDLLVITGVQATSAVSAAVTHYQEALNGAAPVGVTLTTAAELSARRITPRVAFALHQIQQGQPVLYAAPEIQLPHISQHDLVLAASQEFPQVILTLRRLRAESRPEQLRQLYKHIVLACRLLLREHGSWPAGADQILATSSTLSGFPTLEVPLLADVAAAWRERRAHYVLSPVTEAADRLLAWYAHNVAA